MPTINGILTQSQASENNLAASVKQWIYTQIVGPYNTAAAAMSPAINNGMQLQSNNTWASNPLGLTVMMNKPTDRSFYEYVPVAAYNIDYKPTKDSVPTGCGDGADWEYRSVSVTFLPAFFVGTDGKTFQADKRSKLLLKSYAVNAFQRTHIIPIVDSTQSPVSNQYPQIGYCETMNKRIQEFSHIVDDQDLNYLRFDVFFDLRWAVLATN